MDLSKSTAVINDGTDALYQEIFNEKTDFIDRKFNQDTRAQLVKIAVQNHYSIIQDICDRIIAKENCQQNCRNNDTVDHLIQLKSTLIKLSKANHNPFNKIKEPFATNSALKKETLLNETRDGLSAVESIKQLYQLILFKPTPLQTG